MLKFRLAQATFEDKNILVKHRLDMFHDMCPELAEEIQGSEEPTREWINEKLSDGSLIGFIVRTDAGQVAGSGCLWIKKEQPNPTRLRLEAPYLLSMFTEKRFRRKGLARLIVKAAIAWSQEHGYDRITLHATDVGKPLYEEFGFESSNEMKLKL